MNYSRLGTQTVIGFTNPKATFDRMRTLDPRTKVHDSDVRLYSKNETYKQAWTTWYASWRDFCDKTLAKAGSSTDPSALGLLFDTDALAARQAQYEADFTALYDTYKAEKDPNGNPLPSNAPPLVLPPSPVPNGGEKSDGIPLWTLLAIAAGIAVCVGGYYYVQYVRKGLAAKRKVAEELLPGLLTAELGPMGEPLAKIAMARDAGRGLPFAQGASSCQDCGRDLDIRAVPRAPAKYILSGY